MTNQSGSHNGKTVLAMLCFMWQNKNTWFYMADQDWIGPGVSNPPLQFFRPPPGKICWR